MLKLERKCNKKTRRGRCKNKALSGYLFCKRHIEKLTEKRVYSYRPEIWHALEEYKRDGQLDSMDLEIAYLQKLVGEIEQSKDLSTTKKFELMTFSLDKIVAFKEKRRKHLIDCHYMMTLETFRLFMAQVYAILKRKLKDNELLKEIGLELSKIRIQALEMKRNA